MEQVQTADAIDSLKTKGPASDVTPAGFRAAMGNFLTGVAVVTTTDADAKFGITVNSLTSVSVDPCQLLVCFNHNSAAGNAVRRSGLFVVNILAAHQRDIAMRFARPSDDDRFANIAHEINSYGLPVFDGVLCSVVCSLDQVIDSGDHEIFIGSAQSCDVVDGDPLAYFRGNLNLTLNTEPATATGQ